MPPSRTPAARAAAVFTVLFAALLSLVAVHWAPLESVDRAVDDALHRSALAHGGWTEANRILTDWAWDPTTMRVVLAAAAVHLVWRRRWPLALWVVGTSAVGTVLQQGIKAGVGRPRPHWSHPVDSAHYASFPSGHALTAIVTCGLLLWLLRLHRVGARWWRPAVAAAGVSVLGVGFTRLYLGVHWLSDVVGGWLLGAALVCAAAAAWPSVHGRTRGPVAPAGREPGPYPHRRPSHPVSAPGRPRGRANRGPTGPQIP
jgi:membrane-associated phospholipid phosphatase